MTSRVQVGIYNDGIECSPDALYRGLAGCFGFLLTCMIATSLSVIAGGVYWTAQNLDRVTNTGHFVLLDVQGTIM